MLHKAHHSARAGLKAQLRKVRWPQGGACALVASRQRPGAKRGTPRARWSRPCGNTPSCKQPTSAAPPCAKGFFWTLRCCPPPPACFSRVLRAWPATAVGRQGLAESHPVGGERSDDDRCQDHVCARCVGIGKAGRQAGWRCAPRPWPLPVALAALLTGMLDLRGAALLANVLGPLPTVLGTVAAVRSRRRGISAAA